ncbi:SGNH/GDSL hydrolase family protein [Dysgonomonas sp. 25]|uniref:SGNH/GDSL hydrolase family protein n=1 Tax=Dysgonomonas sp. 25 TaxID=2302933 RepID=UPI0013D7B25B|nr:SGNH/GDSL hydrolase family protein [Dysgonomonas sp. 25]NDV69170.1 capsular biosynthesis protein [Dysgonomonas sp. 25]
MKKAILILLFFTTMIACINAQFNKEINLQKYAQANAGLPAPEKKEKRVVFIGNSITEAWVSNSPDFFAKNNYVGRGISGQTTLQMLLRFRQDVIKLQPKAVVICAGTNDIAENTGTYDPEFTFGNIVSMVELAKANKIKVIIASVHPAGAMPWHPHVTDVPAKIHALNYVLKDYAKTNKIPYIDYHAAMEDGSGAMRKELSADGVHPNKEGYAIMESLAKPIVDKVVK